MKWPLKSTSKKPKSKLREWVDALVFAVVFATLIRTLLFSAYAIPSGSMERSMLTGDYLFVSKIAYGARMPFTPVSVPFLEANYGDTKTYWDGIRLGYHRLPGLSAIKHNDIVVFNKPEEVDRPIDMRTHLIKRCIALPGDILTIKNSIVFINGKPAERPQQSQTSYLVKTDGSAINPKQIQDLHIEVRQQISESEMELIMTDASMKMLKQNPVVKSITPVIEPAGSQDMNVFPHDKQYAWNEDNFGPLQIPRKGMTIALNEKTLPLYKKAIEKDEQNKLEIKGRAVFINDKPASAYTFKMDYYWMMGDNRHNSLDCRFWGMVPEDHIVGKAIVVVFSKDDAANSLFDKIRWNRFFTMVK